ncbi:MAG: response regulator [Dongiaceae bacterium]
MKSAAEAGRPRVLVVEDEALVAFELEDIISEGGFAVVGPANALDSALVAAEREPIDAAVLDINLRGELSFPVAYALRSRQIPFFFLTGYVGEIMVPDDLQGVKVLSKPYQAQRLITTLRRLLPNGA